MGKSKHKISNWQQYNQALVVTVHRDGVDSTNSSGNG